MLWAIIGTIIEPYGYTSLATSKIAIVGEAWGEREAQLQRPFVGYTGHILDGMLRDAGIDREQCLVTNVFNLHPPGNKLEFFCGPKSQSIPGYSPLVKGKHVRAEFIPELNRLAAELAGFNPNIIIGLGNTAMWALLGQTGITKLRGTTHTSTYTAIGFKVLFTFHPSFLVRGQWSQRPIVVLDLIKAKRESATGEVARPAREIWIEPTLEDLYEFERRYIQPSTSAGGILSIDIETTGKLITCVGIAVSAGLAIVIPFFDRRRKTRNYWDSHDAEREAWLFIKRILELPSRKLFQNGLYDIAFLYRAIGIRVRGAEHDTMLLHHALQPESLKGLGFLGSIYTDEGAWKQMRGRTKTIKREE
jgi:uracil-DNA glycosylase